MSLDIILIATRPTVIFDANVTHNLNKMAEAAGVYQALWRPEEIGVTHAADLIHPLRTGLLKLKTAPSKYRKLNPANGWGSYDNLVKVVEDLLNACTDNPDATVEVSR